MDDLTSMHSGTKHFQNRGAHPSPPKLKLKYLRVESQNKRGTM